MSWHPAPILVYLRVYFVILRVAVQKPHEGARSTHKGSQSHPAPCALILATSSRGANRAPNSRIPLDSALARIAVPNATSSELRSLIHPINVGENASPSR